MNPVHEFLANQSLPVEANLIACQLKARIEEIYLQLVELEAVGKARIILRYFGERNGWIVVN